LDDRLKELEGGRVKLTEPVDGVLLKRYEKVLENRGKTALSLISGECCSECNMKLRPQIINEAHLNADIVICENCQRILYTED